MLLVVGLGNYLPQYVNNRHNFGFLMLDKLAQHYGSTFSSSNKFQGQFASVHIYEAQILFLKPETFMNCSGNSAVQVAKFFHIPTTKILVIHDNLELKFGCTQFKLGGSNRGHNGLKSITNQLQSNNYYRYCLGIGRPPQNTSVTSYVLSNFTSEEVEYITKFQNDFVTVEFPILVQKILMSQDN